MLSAEYLLQNKRSISKNYNPNCEISSAYFTVTLLSFCVLFLYDFMGISRYVYFDCVDIFLSF